MKLEYIRHLSLVLIIIGTVLIGSSIYSSIFPEKEVLELRLNVISLLSGFSYLVFALVILNLYTKKS
ncbi:MAG: hypothetical protein QW423_00580 [Candidatus Aenigmatarchaeota archaeon]